MKILLTGGGTLGSVNPLIAIFEEAQKQGKNWEWFWVGTKSGIEKKVVQSLGISYEWLPIAKLRRYLSLHILIDPILLIAAFLRSILIISAIKPDIVVSAGSFVSVPVIWASWIFRKKIIIHQQDIRPTLSNKLTSWCASRITISFKKSLQDYPKEKTEYIGNPVRNSLTKGNAEAAKGKFHLNSDLPTLLITGGSSGADSLNKWVWDNINQISPKANIIHLTGNNKSKPEIKLENYHQIEFLGGDMFHVLVASDLVISRAGISTLTELAYLAKPSIIIPMPGTHQEDNAFYILDEHAALVYRQDQLDVHLIQKVQELLQNKDEREKLSKNIRELMKQGARERMIEIIQAYGFK